MEKSDGTVRGRKVRGEDQICMTDSQCCVQLVCEVTRAHCSNRITLPISKQNKTKQAIQQQQQQNNKTSEA